MHTAQEEKYVFYRFASGDMLNARSCLNSLSRFTKNQSRYCFIQQAVLSYCRPFKTCHGKHNTYKLETSFVPKEHEELHNKLAKYRDQVFAHTDLTIKEPKLHKLTTPMADFYPIMFKNPSARDLEKSLPEFKELISLINNRILEHITKLQASFP